MPIKNAPLHPPTFQKLPEVGYGLAEIGRALNFNGRPYLLPKKRIEIHRVGLWNNEKRCQKAVVHASKELDTWVEEELEKLEQAYGWKGRGEELMAFLIFNLKDPKVYTFQGIDKDTFCRLWYECIFLRALIFFPYNHVFF